MKMEVIGWYELLSVYIQQNYAGRDVLVIFQNDVDSLKEYENFMLELEMLGLAPPHQFRGAGCLIIEMDRGVAKKLINDKNNDFIRLELFSDGEFVCDNM